MTETTEGGPLVLITGVTGFLASYVLDAVLAQPQQYRVRGTLRTVSKGKQILARLDPKDVARVEFAEVTDTATSDLTESLRDVEYVLHVASPYQLVVEDPKRDLLDPAVKGTLNLLEYAAKQPSIKFVGITSSFAAVTNFKAGGPNRPGYVYTEQDWLPVTEEEAVATGGAVAYSCSKKLAEKAAWDFVENQKPHFKIASYNPPMIYGPTLQPTTLASLNTSSKTIYGLVSNAQEMPADRLPLCVHARDVGDAHALSLAQPKSWDHRILLHGGTFTWADAVHYLAETRGEDIKARLPKGWEKSEQKDPTTFATLDCTLAKEVLGVEFRGWKQTLDESLDSLLELEQKPDWRS